MSYTPGSVLLVLDGYTQQEADYTATNGTSVTLDVGANIGDQMMFICYNEIALANVVQRTGDTMLGDLTVPNLTVTGTLTETSALKYKQNIEPLENALQKVKLLQGVKYNKIGYIGEEIGLIADDVDLVIPEVVTKIGDEIEGLNYDF